MEMTYTVPSLSVVVNNYNYGEYLEQALDSALQQLREGDELIVVDDGSTDSSLALLKQREREGSLVLIAQRNQGQMKAVRAGLATARGNVVVLLDSDDYFLEGYLDRLREIYCHNPAVSYVFTRPSVSGNDQAMVEETRDVLDRMAFPPGPIGPTRWAALLFHEFVGVPTSGNSMRLSLAKQIVSLPASIDRTISLDIWRKRIFGISDQASRKHGFYADSVIVTCSSALGALKYYNDCPGFMYRIHGTNMYASMPGRGRWYLRSQRKRLLSPILAGHFSIHLRPSVAELREEIVHRTWALNSRRRLRIRIEYCLATLRSRGPLRQKIACLMAALASGTPP